MKLDHAANPGRVKSSSGFGDRGNEAVSAQPIKLSSLAGIDFDARILEPRHRLDAWRDFYSGVFDIKSQASSETIISTRARFWRAGGLVAGKYGYGAAVTTTPPKPKLDDRVVIRMFLKGHLQARIGDESVRLSPGAVHIQDLSQPYQALSDDVQMFAVAAPHELLGFDPSRNSRYAQHGFETPVGRLLRTNIEMLADLLPTATAAEGETIAMAVIALLRSILTGEFHSEGAREQFERVRKDAMKRFIADHLHEPSLSADNICQAFGVSRPTLYRIFAGDDGVAQYILSEKLKRVFFELVSSGQNRGIVSTIAGRWGFHDPSVFARQFRRQFGFPPSDAVGCSDFGLSAVKNVANASGFLESAKPKVTPYTSLIG